MNIALSGQYAEERPLAVDLFCGLGGWTDGLLAENYRVIGFDIEQHVYGEQRYPAQLVIQDVLTLHGSQFRDASLIVASPPCQEFSWLAMPWSRAKQVGRALRGADCFPVNYRGSRTIEDMTRLFDACFRIQREACEAAGRHIPLIVENVRGAQPWVGPSRWNFGSFHLFGDVPALMPAALKGRKNSGGSWFNIAHNTESGHGQNPDGRKVAGFRFDGSGRSFQSASVAETGIKAPGMNWSDQTKRGQDFTRIAGNHAAATAEGLKGEGGSWFFDADNPMRRGSSKGAARKAASAMIAKIPLPLSAWIARCFLPRAEEAA